LRDSGYVEGNNVAMEYRWANGHYDQLSAMAAAVPAFYSRRIYRSMVAFMAANRLPAIYSNREFVEAGGLIAYATNFDDLMRQAAGYVDKILKGALPGELPVRQAATFELLVNAATAKGGIDDPAVDPRPRQQGHRLTSCRMATTHT
jgi:ABC-type uncharacterized transport system substrate-binding protein